MSFFKALPFVLVFMSETMWAQSNSISSPYLLEESTYSVASVKSGLPLRERFNYNCESQRMEFLDENNLSMQLSNTTNIDTLYLGSHKMVPYQQRFLEVFYKGPSYELLVDYKLNAVNKGKRNNGFGINSHAGGIESIDLRSVDYVAQENRYKNLESWKFVPRHTYYIHIGNKTKRFSDKKTLIKIFPNQQEEIEMLLIQMKVSFSDPENVNMLLNALMEK